MWFNLFKLLSNFWELVWCDNSSRKKQSVQHFQCHAKKLLAANTEDNTDLVLIHSVHVVCAQEDEHLGVIQERVRVEAGVEHTEASNRRSRVPNVGRKPNYLNHQAMAARHIYTGVIKPSTIEPETTQISFRGRWENNTKLPCTTTSGIPKGAIDTKLPSNTTSGIPTGAGKWK